MNFETLPLTSSCEHIMQLPCSIIQQDFIYPAMMALLKNVVVALDYPLSEHVASSQKGSFVEL